MPRQVALLVLVLAALAALPQPAAGQEPSRLRIAIPGEDGSLTPYTFTLGYEFMTLVYDTLTHRDAKGIPQPWLARSIDRDASGERVFVRLRQGIRWQDGRPLTADDVKFTYDFMRRRTHPRFTPELQDIDEIGISGDRLTITFFMRRRSLGFEDQPLADVPIIPRHLWQDLPRDRLAPPGPPIGTGPYRLVAHEPGRSYRFVANKDYFRGAPSIRRIDVPVIHDEDDVVDELRRGVLDAGPLQIPPGTTPRGSPSVTLSDEPSYTGTMLLFNVATRPFHRLAARRAVAAGLDLRRIAGNASGVSGGATPAERGMLHPRSRWSRAGVLHRFDPGAARLAFTEQGIEPFRVAVSRNDKVRLEVAERVVRALVDVGARAQLLELSPQALDRALGRRRMRATFDAAVVGFPELASYDPAYLRAVFGDPRTAPLNDGSYRSDRFAELADRAASATTELARRFAVSDQLKLLARDLPAVPLMFGGATYAYRPASYDRWVSIRGAGILDKRSFLHGAAPASPEQPAAAKPGDLLDPDVDEGFSLLPLILGLLVLLAAGGGWWLWRRRA